jgi:hypothetical protein
MKDEPMIFKLSDRLTVEFVIESDNSIRAEWEPGIPKRFTEAEAQAYRQARGQMLQLLAQRIGGNILCIG